jgi:hypothetical protein
MLNKSKCLLQIRTNLDLACMLDDLWDQIQLNDDRELSSREIELRQLMRIHQVNAKYRTFNKNIKK